MDSYYKQIFIL